MKVTTDLHSHSGHAGGVGNINLPDIADTMLKKGIDVFGTGDCLQPQWLEFLENNLAAKEDGLFTIDSHKHARFLLQTEIIVTAPAPVAGRKTVHTIILFPSFTAAKAVLKKLESWQVKVNMGRPFLRCESSDEVAQKMHEICAAEDGVTIIPAHVLTPQGIYGSERPVKSMRDFYGDFADEIKIIETGLSADPQILGLIPELDGVSFISNSDGHSAALNRVGREFTALECREKSYHGIIEAMKKRDILYTIEFTPAEGRFFLTGHRAGKKGHEHGEYCYFSPQHAPDFCPVCGKELTVGVLQRAMELGKIQGQERDVTTLKPKQKFITAVPLTEVIASGLSVKSVTSTKVLKEFETIIAAVGKESELWEMGAGDIESELDNKISPDVLEAILKVRRGYFSFSPLGYDGEYGTLVLEQDNDWFNHNVIHYGTKGPAERSGNLFQK